MRRTLWLLALILLPAVAQAAQAQTVKPRACNATTVATGGTAVVAISGQVGGYYIANPATAADQGLGSTEQLYVDPTKTATLSGNGTNAPLVAGQPFYGVGGTNVSVSVNAASSGHTFTCVRW